MSLCFVNPEKGRAGLAVFTADNKLKHFNVVSSLKQVKTFLILPRKSAQLNVERLNHMNH